MEGLEIWSEHSRVHEAPLNVYANEAGCGRRAIPQERAGNDEIKVRRQRQARARRRDNIITNICGCLTVIH